MMAPPERWGACYRYLNLIRNAPKRQYGFAYVAWLANGSVGHEPECHGLSVMGAQAVRLRIQEFDLWNSNAEVR
jgi:hypothetical protein